MPDDTRTTDPNTTARPSAEVMSGVIPYLDMNGRAAEAADFYARAFGAKDLGRMAIPRTRAATCMSRSRSTAAR